MRQLKTAGEGILRGRGSVLNLHIRWENGYGKKFRVSYDWTAGLDPCGGGSGIMWDAQAAGPHAFRTGDGWSAYNLPSPRVNYQLHSRLPSGATGPGECLGG